MLEDDQNELLERLRDNRRRLGVALRKLAKFGDIYAPDYLILEVEDIRAEIARIKQILCDWKIQVDENPDDYDPGDDKRAAFSTVAIPGMGINSADIKRLLLSIETQSQASGDGKLYQALRGLNYSSQTAAFMLSVKARTVAAYLIDGQRKYGQRWLLNLLLKRYEHSIQAISIDMRRLGRGKSVADLCQEIGRKAGVAANTPDQLAGVLCRWWETQHTFLIFHSVDLVDEAYLREILANFWAPIVKHACDSQYRAAGNKLLLFLVDNQGVASSWNLPFAKNSADDPGRPERLPSIARFSEDELSRWMMASLLDLPDDFSERTDVQTILVNTDNGIPESVLEEICVICDYDWNEGASRWLKH